MAILWPSCHKSLIWSQFLSLATTLKTLKPRHDKRRKKVNGTKEESEWDKGRK